MGNLDRIPPRSHSKDTLQDSGDESIEKLRKNWLKIELSLFGLLLLLLVCLAFIALS